tara:strand:+ start:184 stop:1191 length:1008 start_codon:yes stop_codon:yes gene_type:complete
MYFNLIISKEEKLIISILFKKEDIEIDEFKNVCFEKLVQIASSHLILPALYSNAKKKNLLKFFPEDLNSFLKKIFEENNRRNQILIKELNELSKILAENNISHLFVKGAYNIKTNLYDNLGERMVGDIDFLVNKSDLNLTEKILLKNGYKNSKVDTKKFWIRPHIPKLINTKKLFSVEIHREQLRYFKRNLLPAKELLESKRLKKNNYLLKLCVLNYQVNDYGATSLSYSFRSIYDYVLLSKKYEMDSKDFKIRDIRNFFLITDTLGITHNIKKINLVDRIILIRFYFKKTYKFYYLIDNFIVGLIKVIPTRFLQFFEFIFDRKYRKYVFKKFNI